MDAILHVSERVSVGRFQSQVDDPNFRDSGPIHDHLFVVPTTAVEITHAGRRTVVADRNSVMFYNRSQVYRRGPVSRRGDRCLWFRVRRDLLDVSLRRFDPAVSARPHRPFAFRRGPMSLGVYLDACRLGRTARTDEAHRVESGVLGLLDRVLTDAYRYRKNHWVATESAGESKPGQRALVEAARGLLAARYAETLTLEEIASDLATSPFHLARTFRRCAGTTLHAYRTELRLRAAVERLGEGAEDLSGLAHELGFSSHSHFTSVFRRWIGKTPSRVRAQLSAERACAGI